VADEAHRVVEILNGWQGFPFRPEDMAAQPPSRRGAKPAAKRVESRESHD
jgi:hypothetical protein